MDSPQAMNTHFRGLYSDLQGRLAAGPDEWTTRQTRRIVDGVMKGLTTKLANAGVPLRPDQIDKMRDDLFFGAANGILAEDLLIGIRAGLALSVPTNPYKERVLDHVETLLTYPTRFFRQHPIDVDDSGHALGVGPQGSTGIFFPGTARPMEVAAYKEAEWTREMSHGHGLLKDETPEDKERRAEQARHHAGWKAAMIAKYGPLPELDSGRGLSDP